jgi:hypothetical protein
MFELPTRKSGKSEPLQRRRVDGKYGNIAGCNMKVRADASRDDAVELIGAGLSPRAKREASASIADLP